MLQRETPEFIPPEMWPPNSPDLNLVDYSIWGVLQERVYRSWIHDASWKNVEREWRLLDNAHRQRLRSGIVVWMHVFAWMVDILNIRFEPLTFCCVLFVSSILVALNVIDINTCKVLISCEMCYFCVWDFHTVWQQHNKCMARNFYANDFSILLRSCARLWKSVNISKSYSKKNQWHLFFLDTV